MSEWDYLPTPYESLVESECKNTLLTFISFCCLVEGKVISPSDLFIMCGENEQYDQSFQKIINRTSITQVLRNMLQFEDIRSQKKRDKIVQIVKSYVDRHGKENI